MQKLVFPMRETMPYFVCSLRQVDEWKRFRARNSQVFAKAEYDVNAKYIKSPFAKSLKIEDLVRFLDDTAIDMEFMVQLPSIEKCLEQWWQKYATILAAAPSASSLVKAPLQVAAVGPDQLRQVYYDLANVLVQANTETIHKNSVSMIMRAAWTKWSTTKDTPLSKPEFARLLFVLAHLMTESNRLDDYVAFFQETLAKITRVDQSKVQRTEQRKRKPRMHRKSSLVEIMGSSGSVIRMSMSMGVDLGIGGSRGLGDDTTRAMSLSNQMAAGGLRAAELGSYTGGAAGEYGSGGGGGVANGTVNVTLQRVLTSQPSATGMMLSGHHDTYSENGSADQFVEVLDRRGVYAGSGMAQHVVVDPLLMERRFQDKWSRPVDAELTLSTDDTLRELHPVTNKYVPPLSIARLHTSPLSAVGRPGLRGLLLHNRQCQSTPALKLKSQAAAAGGSVALDQQQRTEAEQSTMGAHRRDDCDDEVLRRSLSMVTLKKRIQQNKCDANHTKTKADRQTTRRKWETEDEGESRQRATIDLAIST